MIGSGYMLDTVPSFIKCYWKNEIYLLRYFTGTLFVSQTPLTEQKNL